MFLMPLCGMLLSQCVWLEPEVPVQKKRARAQVFAVPGKKYGLSLDMKGFVVDQDELRDAKTGRYVMASDNRSEINISFWLLPAEGKGDSKACRTKWWAKELSGPFKPKDVKQREKGNLAIVDYKISDPIEQKNVRVYLAHKDTWIDIHLSIVRMTPAADKAIARLLESIKVVDPYVESDKKKGATVDVNAEVTLASRLYLQHDYQKAACHYQKAIDSEKKDRTLNERTWRVAVDNLGMCYGMTGQFKKAKTVFEYGIKEDPKYPMFHYNLACTYGEMGDEPHAISALKKAYALKDNMIEGEQIPNPRTDSSFNRFKDSKAFRDALTEIGV